MFTQPPQIPRSPLASAMTVVFHTCLVVAAVAMTAVPNMPAIARHDRLVFVTTETPRDIEFTPPPAPRAAEAPRRLERPEPPPVVKEAPAVEKFPAPPLPRPVEPPKAVDRPVPPPVAPRVPPVVTGEFGEAPAPRAGIRATGAGAAGFDASATPRAGARLTVGSVDGFGSSESGSKAGRGATSVADAGFGATAKGEERKVARLQGGGGFAAEEAPRAPVQPSRVTNTSGFVASQAPSTPAPVVPKPATQAAGFADTPQAAKAAPAPTKPTPSVERPVEVTYKPAPAYTEEARARHVEGEVLLDVEFTAGGKVRILRVVRGLGYGLDEMAQRAAEQIRFKPATSNGTPVDTRATLTIVFRLT